MCFMLSLDSYIWTPPVRARCQCCCCVFLSFPANGPGAVEVRNLMQYSTGFAVLSTNSRTLKG